MRCHRSPLQTPGEGSLRYDEHGRVPVMLGVIGVITPVAILAVNASAWIVEHLAQWRDGVAVMAFISALVLNSSAGIAVYRYLVSRWPDTIVTRPANVRWILGFGAVIILATALGAGYFSFVGMEKPSQLPNGTAVVTAVLALLVPLGITYASTAYRSSGKSSRRRKRMVDQTRSRALRPPDRGL